MSLSLYQLSGDYLQALDFLTDPEMDFDSDAVTNTLEGLAFEVETKAINVAKFLRNMEVTAEAMKVAESDMAKRRKALENRVLWLKSYLKGSMETTGISKIECPYFKLSIAKNPTSLEILDESAIPEEFKRTETVTVLDKAAIKAALQNGHVFPGAKLTNGTRLVIK
jgi:hypothetical protein